MTSKEKELLLAWLVNQELRIEEEVKQSQQNLRFRKIDIVDCFDLAILQQRLYDFQEFALIVIRLLNIERG